LAAVDQKNSPVRKILKTTIGRLPEHGAPQGGSLLSKRRYGRIFPQEGARVNRDMKNPEPPSGLLCLSGFGALGTLAFRNSTAIWSRETRLEFCANVSLAYGSHIFGKDSAHACVGHDFIDFLDARGL